MVMMSFGQRVLKEIADGRADTVAQPGGGDVFARDRFCRRQIEGNALEMRMPLGGFYAKQAGRTTDVAKSLEL